MRAILLVFLVPFFQGKAQSALDRKIAAAMKTLSCPRPNEASPVMLNAALVVAGDSIGVIVKVELAPGWHIYDYVPSTLPYIPIDTILRLPGDLRAVGAWIKSVSSSSAMDPGVLIFENEAVFIHKVIRAAPGGGKIQTGLYYQTCNVRQCLPPVEKTIDLIF